jgi:hypothetical protein
MVDEKDRLGEKLRDKQKAEEDSYFAQRDREAIQRLKAQETDAARAQILELTKLRCPKDAAKLTHKELLGVPVEECPHCGGMWLDKGEMEELAKREHDSWIGRIFYRPKL